METKKLTFEDWQEMFFDLDLEIQIEIYNHLRDRHGFGRVYEFTEDAINEIYPNAYDGMRALFFGDIRSWNDDYIYLNGYANLESMTADELEENIELSAQEIYDTPDTWKSIFEDYYAD